MSTNGTVVHANDLTRDLRRGRNGRPRAARRLARHPAGRPDRDHGAVGFGQVDADAHPRGPRQADGRATSSIAGTQITRLGDSDLTKLRREHIGFVFQFFNLLPMLTAEENVLLPLTIAGEKPDPEFFETLLIQTSASPTAAPTALPSSPAASSSASRSRAHSSRARRSSSPTSPRATSTRRPGSEILDLLRHSVEEYGQTTVMVTHEPRAAAIADRVLFLADGRIVKELPRSTQPEILAALEAITTA